MPAFPDGRFQPKFLQSRGGDEQSDFAQQYKNVRLSKKILVKANIFYIGVNSKVKRFFA
jgi:hypothetical protein